MQGAFKDMANSLSLDSHSVHDVMAAIRHQSYKMTSVYFCC